MDLLANKSMENSTSGWPGTPAWINVTSTPEVKQPVVPFVVDLDIRNNSETPWTSSMMMCTQWEPANHLIFQLANVAIFGGLLAPDTTYGVLCLHSLFVLGFLLLSIWSWVILCAPDFFSWNFAFMTINAVQTLFLMYHIRPVIFCEELEKLYNTMFQPLRVPRSVFKKLVCSDFCTLMTLHEGEAYATQSLTRTDKLGLLISGTMHVYSNRNFLHSIKCMQFIDSPEFESSVTGDEKFQVSIVAGGLCRYIFWSRQSLEYLLVKEPYIASIMNTLLGRDITNKLYVLNAKVSTPHGSRLDIRLPSVSSTLRSRPDIRKAVAGVRDRGGSREEDHTDNCDLHSICINTKPDHDSEEEDDFQEHSERVELLNGHVRVGFIPSHGDSPCSSISESSGIHFDT